jgi:hypothetical protein
MTSTVMKWFEVYKTQNSVLIVLAVVLRGYCSMEVLESVDVKRNLGNAKFDKMNCRTIDRRKQTKANTLIN